MTIENIQCVGDVDKSSFLIFDSGEARKTININNLNIINGKSNGPFIKIMGNLCEVHINNSEIQNVKSYGSIIKDISLKSIISFSNLNFEENNNINKLECENKSLNGGALYFKESNYSNKNNSSDIQFNNNLFENNDAEYFGGAIYSEYGQLYLAKTLNNSIIYNKAGVTGGGIYSPFSVKKNLFDIKSIEIENNIANGLTNNYASRPSYIVLNTKLDNKITEIKSGDNFPLTLTLYDEFDQIYDDIIKYYPLFGLNFDLIQKKDLKNDFEEEYNNNYEKSTKIIGNKCYFNKGVCELSDLRIYGIPNNNYILDIKVENFEGNDVEMKFDPIIEIKVLTCDEYHIKMHDKNGILSCEIPICNNDCPVSSTAVCKPYTQEIESDKKNKNENNICECLPGWEGKYCEEQKIVDFK
ncbi:hypothetical protein PIROE2DRAFT_61520 [Piromyces sp. E2]|nr:hypothetical protein PIROE2DRAFT_61520 [Piromyces sp. E2]|eukprot:OUM63051.1 hypothetical protein PIROE2DRAFT_61520 [Piromyces sp. E2]